MKKPRSYATGLPARSSGFCFAPLLRQATAKPRAGGLCRCWVSIAKWFTQAADVHAGKKTQHVASERHSQIGKAARNASPANGV